MKKLSLVIAMLTLLLPGAAESFGDPDRARPEPSSVWDDGRVWQPSLMMDADGVVPAVEVNVGNLWAWIKKDRRVEETIVYRGGIKPGRLYAQAGDGDVALDAVPVEEVTIKRSRTAKEVAADTGNGLWEGAKKYGPWIAGIAATAFAVSEWKDDRDDRDRAEREPTATCGLSLGDGADAGDINFQCGTGEFNGSAE